MTDPLGDMLTRIRNGQQARKDSILTPASRLRANVLDVLQREGYIRGYTEEVLAGQKGLRIDLKYFEGQPAIHHLARISKPGRYRVAIVARSWSTGTSERSRRWSACEIRCSFSYPSARWRAWPYWPATASRNAASPGPNALGRDEHSEMVRHRAINNERTCAAATVEVHDGHGSGARTTVIGGTKRRHPRTRENRPGVALRDPETHPGSPYCLFASAR